MLFVQNSLTHPHPKHTSTPPKHTHPTQQWHHFHHHLALRASSPFTKIGAFRTGTKNGSAKSGSQIQINVVCVRLDTARSKQSCQIRIKAPACPCRGKVVYWDPHWIRIAGTSPVWSAPVTTLKTCWFSKNLLV